MNRKSQRAEIASRPRQRQLPGAAGRHGRPVAIDGLVYRLGDRGRARAAGRGRESAGECGSPAPRRASVYARDEVVHEHANRRRGRAGGCCWDAAWPRAAGAERSRGMSARAPAAESPVAGRQAGRRQFRRAPLAARARQRGREVVRGLGRVRPAPWPSRSGRPGGELAAQQFAGVSSGQHADRQPDLAGEMRRDVMRAQLAGMRQARGQQLGQRVQRWKLAALPCRARPARWRNGSCVGQWGTAAGVAAWAWMQPMA